MYRLAVHQPGFHTRLHRPLEDPLESLLTPPLTYPRQAAVIRQLLVQPVTGKPAHRQVYLRLTHQLPVVDNPGKEPGQHQSQRRLRVDARPPVVRAVTVTDLIPQPGEIEHPVNLPQNVVFGYETTQGTSHKDVFLPAILIAHHRQ
jgi:hypothetical protein